MELSKFYDFKQSEKKWIEFWEKNKVHKFDSKKSSRVYSIDTPPPTVSGMIHLGHAFSYSQQDFIVRFRRMQGYNVFYPFGTDDNGLPTERMVEKLKNVRSIDMSRNEFVELCNKTISEIKENFIYGWKSIGMSCDFENSYSTIDKHCIKTSQKSFIDLFKKNLVYRHEAPTMWCVTCQTAIAQAELEDKELSSNFSDVYFELENSKKLIISTTRPELIPACVCVFVHPDDKRYKNIVGKKAKIPLFNYSVPIFADKSADPKKGSGILMVCSWGDKYDVEAINKKKLNPRICFTKDGRLNELTGKYVGLKIKEAREKILEDLEKEGFLVEKKKITHIVNVHDKCGTEIEFLASKQWFIKLLANKKKLLDAGKKIKWYPSFMHSRYTHWINGLSWDWCISRQRHFGVPFPIWYCKKCNEIIIADEKDLPIDPLKSNPKKKCKCGSNEFIGESDVMDTWATSSVSPQIALNWIKDKGYDVNFEKMYPMSLRPQAHDIIRTWAFYTIVKGIYHHNKIPWNNIMISGHIQDSKGRKMSKSLGNVIEPREVLDKYGADSFRFMAASSKLGEDMPYQEKEIVSGQKLINKLWNASKFCFIHLNNYKFDQVKELEIMDEYLLIKLNSLIEKCTKGFEEYEYSKPKAEIEQFFFHTFCDNYLEIIKDRLYNPAKRGKAQRVSAQYTLYQALSSILKLLAPIMPFVTEEIYQNYFIKKEKVKSIHICKWPEKNKKLTDKNLEKIGDEFINTLNFVRQKKAEKNLSLKEPVKILYCDDLLKEVVDDLKAVTNAQEIKFGKLELEF